jgi:putative flippase GtrA
MRFHQIRNFFKSSLAGVSIDLVVFKLLTLSHLRPAWANIISSSLSITATYFLTSRLVFQAEPTFAKWALFVPWYAFSITAFSGLIASLVAATSVPPFFCKLATLQLSFFANYTFCRLAFNKKPCPTAS